MYMYMYIDTCTKYIILQVLWPSANMGRGAEGEGGGTGKGQEAEAWHLSPGLIPSLGDSCDSFCLHPPHTHTLPHCPSHTSLSSNITTLPLSPPLSFSLSFPPLSPSSPPHLSPPLSPPSLSPSHLSPPSQEGALSGPSVERGLCSWRC